MELSVRNSERVFTMSIKGPATISVVTSKSYPREIGAGKERGWAIGFASVRFTAKSSTELLWTELVRCGKRPRRN